MKQFHVYKDHIKKELVVLRKKAKVVSFPLSKENTDIAKQLIDYVEYSKDESLAKKFNITQAYGIAAPQLGESIRMFYVSVPESYNNLDVVEDSEKEFSVLLINPVLVKYQNITGAFKGGESCLSVNKNYKGEVVRPVSIEIKGYNLIKKKEVTIKAKGRLAIILLHELDHLNGVLYYDYIKENKRNIDYMY